MYPEFFFSIFGSSYSVWAYDAFSVLAISSVLVLAPLTLRRAGLRTEKGLLFTLVLLAAFLAGARLLNYAVNPLQYGDSLQIWSRRFTGFSLYGGLIAAGLSLPALSSAFRFRLWAAADALVLPAGTAFCLARMGCFLNGCCGGKVTDSVIGVVFPVAEKEAELMGRLFWFADSPVAAAVWPTQLFELGLALLGMAVLLPLSRRLTLQEGSAALIYVVWFSAVRWAVLPFRSLPYDPLVTDVFYPALYGTIILACGAVLYWRNRRQAERDLKTIDGEQGMKDPILF